MILTFSSKRTVVKKIVGCTVVVVFLFFATYMFSNSILVLSYQNPRSILSELAAIADVDNQLKNNSKLIASTGLKDSNVLGQSVDMKTFSGVPVLLYHGLVTQKDGTNTPIDDFKNQMIAMKENGYQSLTLADLINFSSENKALPEKIFMITFDDGRRDSYYLADPILKKLGYNAVMFVITSTIRSPGSMYLSGAELRAMVGSGRWELQSHGHGSHTSIKIDKDGHLGHFLSNKKWLDKEQRIETDLEYRTRIESDLHKSDEELKKITHHETMTFAFPYGDYGQVDTNFSGSKGIINSVVFNIFRLAFYQEWNKEDLLYYPQKSGMVKRIDIESSASGSLQSLILKNKKKPMSYTDDLSNNNGWFLGGGVSVEEGALFFDSLGNNIYTRLNGTDDWLGYRSELLADPIRDGFFSLVVSYKDDNNFGYCQFTPSKVSYIERIEGRNKERYSYTGSFGYSLSRQSRLGVIVENNSVTCLVDGMLILRTSQTGLDDRKGKFGIGYKSSNRSKFKVDNLNVTKI